MDNIRFGQLAFNMKKTDTFVCKEKTPTSYTVRNSDVDPNSFDRIFLNELY